MLRWLQRKNPRRDLQRAYEAAMREARDIQRRGDIRGFAEKSAEAERIRRRLDELDSGGLDTGTSAR